MNLHLYTECHADEVKIGDTVLTTDGVPITVNEVRHLIEDAQPVVSLLGHRPGSNAQRREHLRCAPQTPMQVLPTRQQVREVWSQLTSAVAFARTAWDDDDDFKGAPPWVNDADTGMILIQPYDAAGPLFRLLIEADPEPTPDPDPDLEPF